MKAQKNQVYNERCKIHQEFSIINSPLSIFLASAKDLARYQEWVQQHPHGSLWQSLAWKAYQEALGREVRIYVDEQDGTITASALVTIDRTAGGFSVWEVPRGPLGEWRMQNAECRMTAIPQAFLDRIIADAKQDGCLTVYLSPTMQLTTENCRLTTSPRHIHPVATRIINLTQPEAAILAQMKPKGRYNIGVAQRHGVRVEESDDVEAFYALLEATAVRDRFRPPARSSYKAFLASIPGSFLLLARHPDAAVREPIAGLIGVVWPKNGIRNSELGQANQQRIPNNQQLVPIGIYYYGASSHEHRALMAPYALQWAAMRRCKAAGCASYDLLGIAPPDAVADHPWQGVSGFKEKFGGTVVEYPAERQVTLRPVMSTLLGWKRRIVG